MGADEQSSNIGNPSRCPEGRSSTLMPSPPHVGWPDFATNQDLDYSITAIERRLVAKIRAETRRMVFGIVATNFGAAGLAFALWHIAA